MISYRFNVIHYSPKRKVGEIEMNRLFSYGEKVLENNEMLEETSNSHSL